MKLKKAEMLVFALILCIAAAAWILMQKNRTEKDCGSIRITVDGAEYATYPLNKDRTISIGETNVCRISNGTASMIDASCPDHLCMQQPSIDSRGGMIICLPNRVTIEGIPAADTESEFDLDGITG